MIDENRHAGYGPACGGSQSVNQEKTIRITVRLFGHFSTGRFKESVQIYPEGICAGDALVDLSINDVRSGIVLVNGRSAATGVVLCDKDVLALFPIVSGG